MNASRPPNPASQTPRPPVAPLAVGRLIALITLALTTACSDNASAPADTTADATADTAEPPAPPTIHLLAGSPGPGALPDGTAPRFTGITAFTTCANAADTVYFTDTFGTAIYRVEVPSGTTTRIAGHPARPGLADGPAADARFASPRGLTCLADASALIVADSGAFRRVSLSDGAVTTIAGFPGTPGNTDGDAVDARIGYLIHAMATAPVSGAIFFSDRSNNAIRRLDPETFAVTTISPRAAGWDGPGGLAFSADGDTLWVADTFNDRLRALDPATGAITELAATAPIPAPQGFARADDTAFAVGFDPAIRKIDLTTGAVTTFTTDFAGSFASPVIAAGHIITARLDSENIVAWDFAAASPAEINIAGSATAALVDDLPTASRFGPIADLAHAPDHGAIFIADPANSAIRIFRPTPPDFWGSDPSPDRAAPPILAVETIALATIATTTPPARPIRPAGLALTPDASRLFITDPANGTLWVMSLDAALQPTGLVLALDGLATPTGLVIGPLLGSQLPDPHSTLYIAESAAHRIVRVDIRSGTATNRQVIAGAGVMGFSDGPANTARFDTPVALAIDRTATRLLIGETDGRTLRVLDFAPEARISTWLAPPADPEILAIDGPVASATVGAISGLVALPDGPILIADSGAFTLRVLHLDAQGLPQRLETIAGDPGLAGGVTTTASPPLAAAIFGRIGRPVVWMNGATPRALFIPSDTTVLGLDMPSGPFW